MRYQYAYAHIQEDFAQLTRARVIDLGCGIGYGSDFMGSKGLEVTGFEIDPTAIAYAKEHYSKHSTIVQRDISRDFIYLPAAEAATAFEFIEHVPNPHDVLASLSCQMLIGSVPNEDVIKFDKKDFRCKYHYRHYRAQEIKTELADAGWTVTELGSQTGKVGDGAIVKVGNTTGRTLVFVAVRK
jgi:SAM-dependent methyltransferase